jgi:uncharacterized protein YndB with AHSA1/START domain
MTASALVNNLASTTADREIVITRVFDACNELVFDAWTNPNHLVHWFGPNGFTTTIQKMDVRPGGEWRLVMRGPDGRDYHNRIVYLAVERPARIVYRHEPEPGSEPVTFETTVTFAEHEGKTLLTLCMVFPTAELRDENVRKYGSIEGGKQTLGRLADYLAGSSSLEREIVITRVFDAPRETVFAAWTDPKQLQKWWGPKDFTNPVCECDARVGGKWHIVMRQWTGAEYPCGGVYREVTPPARLTFTNNATDPAGNVVIEGFTQVDFAEHEGGKTLLTLTTRAKVLDEKMLAALAGMHTGWSQSLDKLAVEVGGA